MDERKIAESTDSDALSHLRANRVLLARRINEIALKIVDLRTELETLEEEMKAKAHQLEEVDRGIRALRVDHLSARHAGRLPDIDRHPPS
jgi:predicted  nucleic acid-binding Zn-ribbon protein